MERHEGERAAPRWLTEGTPACAAGACFNDPEDGSRFCAEHADGPEPELDDEEEVDAIAETLEQ